MIRNRWLTATVRNAISKVIYLEFKGKRFEMMLLCFIIFMIPLVARESAFADDVGTVVVVVKGDVKLGVIVELSGGDLSESTSKTTPTNGQVKFTNVSAGVYTVTTRKSGYSFSPEAKNINVVANRTRRLGVTATKLDSKVGTAYCLSCHKNVSDGVYSDWLNGPHANFFALDNNNNPHDYSEFTSTYTYPTDYTQFTGNPSNSLITTMLQDSAYSGKKRAYCLNCHGDSSLDNKSVAKFPLVRSDGSLDEINAAKQAERPVVGCEACHGTGRTHISKPKKGVTYKEPGAAQCGKCHNKDIPSPHIDDNPSAAAGADNPGIYEAYMVSAHTHSLDDATLYSDTKKTKLKAVCAKCHSDQGAKIYKSKDGTDTTLPTLLANEADHTEFAEVQCRTCHNAHNPSELLEAATAATNTATARSAEFNTCTNCHQLLDSSDAKISPYHSDHTTGSITSNHYDNPATQALEGYNVIRTSDTACSNCHNPHVAGTKINEQWAESGHGELTGDPWFHYDWKQANRQACQRCHTPTGFVNFVADQLNYSAANNSFTHLTGLQNDNLTCNGCHEPSSFKRRELGAFDGYVEFPYHAKVRTVATPVAMPAGKISTTDGLVKLSDDSNLCMMCHQGRESGGSIDYVVYGTSTPPYTSFVNEHYLAAAATFFGSETHGNYEYIGKTYVTRSLFTEHEGKADTCVKCHLRTDSADAPDHRFLPQVSDCNGSGCHTGLTDFDNLRPSNVPDYDGDSDTSEGIKGEIDTIRAALYTQIKYYAANVLTFSSTHYPIVYDETTNPYWFRDTNGNGVKDSGETTGYNKFDATLLKACYNYNGSIKEPHGYIHNYKYVLQSLIDSIQDLGGSVTSYTRP